MLSLTLYCPEIPGNVGTLMRLTACWGVRLNLIYPLGFALSDKGLQRASMDYKARAHYEAYSSWQEYVTDPEHGISARRHILLTSQDALPYTQWCFLKTDALILGRESDGFPKSLCNTITTSLHIPMAAGCRSLNMALAASIVLGEAMRQVFWKQDTVQNPLDNI